MMSNGHIYLFLILNYFTLSAANCFSLRPWLSPVISIGHGESYSQSPSPPALCYRRSAACKRPSRWSPGWRCWIQSLSLHHQLLHRPRRRFCAGVKLGPFLHLDGRTCRICFWRCDSRLLVLRWAVAQLLGRCRRRCPRERKSGFWALEDAGSPLVTIGWCCRNSGWRKIMNSYLFIVFHLSQLPSIYI